MQIPAGYKYKGDPTKTHRLMLKYEGRRLPVLWFSVRLDGSLCIGPYNPEATQVKTGTIEPELDGSSFVPYNDGASFRDQDNPGKATFHTSGIINYAGMRAYSQPFEPGTSTREICHILFTQPTIERTKPDRELRKTDVLLPWTANDEHPLFCTVYYTIGAKHTYVDRGTEWKTVFEYPKLDRVGSATLEICLKVAGANSIWPPEEYMIFPASQAKANG